MITLYIIIYKCMLSDYIDIPYYINRLISIYTIANVLPIDTKRVVGKQYVTLFTAELQNNRNKPKIH